MRPVGLTDLASALRLLQRASAPLLHLGPGARSAIPLLADLAVRLGAPVLTTPDAKSSFDETSPYSGGVFSFGARAPAHAMAEAADVVLAVGTHLGEFASLGGNAFGRAKIIHVTDDPSDIATGRAADATLLGDVVTAVRALASGIAEMGEVRVDNRAPGDRWFTRFLTAAAPAHVTRVARSGRIDPVCAVRAIGEALPARARLACDVTSAALHVLHGMALGPERRLWLQIEKSACMGTALAAGLGLRLASQLATLVVIGDWGLLMGASELHTVATLGVAHFVVVVWSNAGGALIRSGVRAQGIDVPTDTHSWPSPRFALMAESFGMRGLTVTTASGLRRAVTAAMRAPFPVLIDAIIDPDAEIAGAQARYLHLETSKRTP